MLRMLLCEFIFILQFVLGSSIFLTKVENRDELSSLVHLRVLNKKSCGGGLATYSYVLTSCRCIGDIDRGKYRVFFVDLFTLIAGYGEHKQARAVKYVEAHPYCKSETNFSVYDIALLKTTSPFKKSKVVRPFTVPDHKLYVVGYMLEVMIKRALRCYAMNVNNGTINIIQVKLTFFEACERSGSMNYSRAQHLCAYPTRGDLCSIASGSPLICAGTMWGIYVSDPNCSLNVTNSITVFARIDRHKTWAQKNICSSNQNSLNANIFLVIIMYFFKIKY